MGHVLFLSHFPLIQVKLTMNQIQMNIFTLQKEVLLLLNVKELFVNKNKKHFTLIIQANQVHIGIFKVVLHLLSKELLRKSVKFLCRIS